MGKAVAGGGGFAFGPSRVKTPFRSAAGSGKDQGLPRRAWHCSTACTSSGHAVRAAVFTTVCQNTEYVVLNVSVKTTKEALEKAHRQ